MPHFFGLFSSDLRASLSDRNTDFVRFGEAELLTMPNVMIRTKVVEEPLGSETESLENVDADASDLLAGKRVCEKTLRFGPSLVCPTFIKHYEGKICFLLGRAELQIRLRQLRPHKKVKLWCFESFSKPDSGSLAMAASP